MIITKTPLRVSLVGGGSDLPAYCNQKPGAVVSFAIDRYMYVIINPHFDKNKIRLSYSETENVSHASELKHDIAREALLAAGIESGVEIVSVCDIPKGSGLGSSSAYTVGLLNALNQYQILYGKPDAQVMFTDLAKDACTVEIDMCNKPIGRQDQYACAYGGINHMGFKGEDVKLMPIDLEKERITEINKHMMFFRFEREVSADHVLHHQTNLLSKKYYMDALEFMVVLTNQMITAVRFGTMKDIGTLLHENWEIKKTLSSHIDNKDASELYKAARKAGAYGGKLCGAGSGGFLMVFAPPEKQQALIDLAAPLYPHRFKIEKQGSHIMYMRGFNG